jgi:GNAT superfamily N-acetyltransferase
MHEVTNGVTVRPEPYDGPVAQTLMAAALADLAERYGGDGDSAPIAAEEFMPPRGMFMVAYVDGGPAGCGGWRTLAGNRAEINDCAEIKRMYTAPQFRGRGVASAVLGALENSARAAGMRQMVLETGAAQPEAIALYTRCGYERIPNFGYYRDYEACRSFGRTLR